MVAADLGRLVSLAARPRAVLVAENHFLRKRLALLCEGLVNIQAGTIQRWHRQRCGIFWRWTPKTAGRPRAPDNRQALIREMAANNPAHQGLRWERAVPANPERGRTARPGDALGIDRRDDRRIIEHLGTSPCFEGAVVAANLVRHLRCESHCESHSPKPPKPPTANTPTARGCRFTGTAGRPTRAWPARRQPWRPQDRQWRRRRGENRCGD